MLLLFLACSPPVYDVGTERVLASDGPPIDVLDQAACATSAGPDACALAADRSEGTVHFSFTRGDPARADDMTSVRFDGALLADVKITPVEPDARGRLSIVIVDAGLQVKRRRLLDKVVREHTSVLLPSGAGHSVVWVAAGSTLSASPVLTAASALHGVLETFVAAPVSSGGLHSLSGLGALLDSPGIRAAAEGAHTRVLLVSDGFHDDPAQPTCQEGVPGLRAAVEAVSQAYGRGDLTVDALGLGAVYRKNDAPPSPESPCGPHGESRFGAQSSIPEPKVQGDGRRSDRFGISRGELEGNPPRRPSFEAGKLESRFGAQSSIPEPKVQGDGRRSDRFGISRGELEGNPPRRPSFEAGKLESTTEELATQGVDHAALHLLAQAGGGVPFVKGDASGAADVLAWFADDYFGRFEVDVRLPDPANWEEPGFRLGVASGGTEIEVDVTPQ